MIGLAGTIAVWRIPIFRVLRLLSLLSARDTEGAPAHLAGIRTLEFPSRPQDRTVGAACRQTIPRKPPLSADLTVNPIREALSRRKRD